MADEGPTEGEDDLLDRALAARQDIGFAPPAMSASVASLTNRKGLTVAEPSWLAEASTR
jgi:hypothetical protein